MNVTSTGIAVALAIIVVFGFFVFGITNPFSDPATSAAIAPEASAPTTDNGALMITDTVEGTGAVANAGDTVSVNYVGKLENGTVFDASANHGGAFSFTLGAGQVIKGWDQGLLGMKVGGKRTLTIPPELAYGDRAVGGVIPANSTLIFDVELVGVQAAQ